MSDIISRANVERLLPLCQRLWPILQQHPPGSADRAAITSTLDSMPATDRHLCDLLLDRMERVIRFRDAWFQFYQGEIDTITPPKEAKRVLPAGPAPKQVWKATRARQGAFARRGSV
ncbi:hypothetical protein KAM448_40430 [Aeromonas caviae]|uniref:Uncharacterized protein n=1 Tax=Aeromonas caviae TaxID=648 RepID=A0ABD0BEE0_AERCA|nr:hypothetical protein [Aeromonas caviae]GJA83577.1 hypothetical protein KAM355_41370 [Aeromonas caviae]GJB13666.1 hypothetical protein KAM362_42260 [Aeromonas caviae]GJB26373.1 hypothetical protein KAM365_41230 [Aeromonas caviae]GJB35023.1 hypothetical protein KAM367_41250 [Aeromonas caviae]GJB61621.1 hypothetical protein KAM374_41570 [Aeromonas caviae]